MSDFFHKIVSNLYYRSNISWKIFNNNLKSQYLPLEKLKQLQFEKLIRLINFAEKNSPYWNNKFSQTNIKSANLLSLNDIQSLPILDKSGLKEIISEDSSNLRDFAAWRSGGSTGEPVTVYCSNEHINWNKAAVLRSYNWSGYDIGDPRARLFAAPTRTGIPEFSLRNRINYWLANNLFIDVSSLDEDDIEKIINLLRKVKPKFVMGYTSSMLTIARILNSRGQNLGIKDLKIVNSAELLSQKARHDIETGFGGTLFDHYGTREIGYIADECALHRGLHVHMEHLLVEIVDKNGKWVKEGDEGEILITELENYGMPIIRYRIGDLAIQANHTCSCGRGLQLLQNISGRITDIIKLPNGKQISGLLFPHIFKDFPILEYQIIQHSLNNLDVKLILESNISEEKKSEIISSICNILPSIEVQVSYVNKIEKSRNGKQHCVISEIT